MGTSADYVRWAQRSLNRIMGASLICDGVEVGPWRPLMGNFKAAFEIQEPGLTQEQIGPKCQNQMIRLNDLSLEYCQWINTCLNVTGDPMGPGAMEKRRKAVMAFQKGRGTVDGWVGPATERALVDFSCSAPPGTYTPHAPKKPKPLPPMPDWLIAWRKLGIQSRYKNWALSCADEVKQIGFYNEEIQDLAQVLARRAEMNPDAYLKYFGAQWIRKIHNDPPLSIFRPEIIKAPDGIRFEVTRANALVFDMGLSDTSCINKIAHKACHSADDYIRNRNEFMAEYKVLWDRIASGMGQFNREWNHPTDNYATARLYVVRGTMEALMRRENSAYWPFRKLKSRKFDGPPGVLKWFPPFWLIDNLVAQ